jgi:hypothetical protein
MIDSIFDFCVWLLVVSANALGMTYKAINVWVFVIIWPILTLALIAIIFFQYQQIRTLRKNTAPSISNIQHPTSNL